LAIKTALLLPFPAQGKPIMLNVKVVLASALASALVGSVIGFGAGQIAVRQHSSQVLTFYSDRYLNLYNNQYIWVGAISGFLFGVGQSCVLQLKAEDEKSRGLKKPPTVLSRDDHPL